MNKKMEEWLFIFQLRCHKCARQGNPGQGIGGAERDRKLLFKYLSVMAFMTQDETTYTHETDMTTSTTTTATTTST